MIIISSKFQTPKKELSMAIVTELTSFTIAIESSISDDRKLQALSKMMK